MAAHEAQPVDRVLAEAERNVLSLLDSHQEIELPELALLHESATESDIATLRLLAMSVERLEPRHVIEFGCGVTTELLAHLACMHGRMAVTSFEHDPWAAAEFVEKSGGLALNYRWFSFCICPLVARFISRDLRPVYDDRMTEPTVPYPADLIVVNGPPDVLGGRSGMIYQALHYSRMGTLVLVLNVRSGEEAIFDMWTGDLASHIAFVPPGLLQRHLVFAVREPLRDAFRLEAPMAQAQSVRASGPPATAGGG